jgi:tRNA(Arg) A34 adenosine deaminase TadA
MDERMDGLSIHLPDWVNRSPDGWPTFKSDAERMEWVVAMARENIARNTGGPFAAAVFERDSGRLVSLGVNSVERLQNSVLHAEIVAIMMAEDRVGSFTLHAPDLPAHELVTSSEPCAMCLGAMLWSGVRRVVFGASRADAVAIGFDEGPVFPESYRYLQVRGIEIVGGVLAGEARSVLQLYRDRGGLVYNG